jgi:CheY-like chemotaxis protein/HPt (histidine-containing phosphotransfer) domain-containing protein
MLEQAIAEGAPFRLALIDAPMPGMPTDALYESISNDPLLSKLICVKMTPLRPNTIAPPSEDRLRSRCISKPIRQRELYRLLTTILAGSSKPEVDRPSLAVRKLVPLTSSAHVLLAEDNRINQEVAIGILSKFGIAVDVANDGLEAIDALSKSNYDLVLMDVQMPVVDGLDATRRIRDTSSPVRRHDVPIIAMTARAMPRDHEVCIGAGMNDFLSKPIVPEDLRKVLEKWLTRTTMPPNDSDFEPKKLAPQSLDDPTPAIYDRTALLNRVLGDEALVEVIEEVFLRDMPSLLDALTQSIAAEDIQSAANWAHTIKGAAANVGGTALYHVALYFEQALRAGDTSKYSGLLSQLFERFELMKRAMSP